MCKDYAWDLEAGAFLSQLKALKNWPSPHWDAPHHFGPHTHVRIADKALLARLKEGCLEVTLLPWAWEDRDHHLFNLSAANRSFLNSNRCLIPATGFYGYTKPLRGQQPDQHLFRLRGHDWFWIAGIVRHGAFAMLTAKSSATMAQFGPKQPCIFAPPQGLSWLQLSEPPADLLAALPRKAFDISILRENSAVRPAYAARGPVADAAMPS